MSDEFKASEMSQCRDAQKWAEWFTETIRENQTKFPTQEECTDYMRAWFANAMMAMHDSIYNSELQAAEQSEAKLREALEFYADKTNYSLSGSRREIRYYSELGLHGEGADDFEEFEVVNTTKMTCDDEYLKIMYAGKRARKTLSIFEYRKN